MKKIIRLVIPVGLFIGLMIIVLSCFQISAAEGKGMEVGITDEAKQGGPPWFDPSWHYRRPVIITNNGASLSYYQVLVRLDSGNFNFNRANADGSDVRFTYSDGTTELKFWIESWDKAHQLAYLWVRIPNLGNGNSTIYIYYNNASAGTASNGVATFDSFEDDWEDFTGEKSNIIVEATPINQDDGTHSPFEWVTISGAPSASEGILTLEEGDGIKSNSTYLYHAVGMRANFKSGDGNKWGGFINEDSGARTIIGDPLSDVDDVYLIDYVSAVDEAIFHRVGGDDWHDNYHIYELRWKAGESKGDIDHGMSSATSNAPAQVPSTSLPVTLYSHSGSGADLLVDWVYVRQYRDPEPTFNIGSEQGLVELSIEDQDIPDPVGKGQLLTYQLSIHNTSSINAPDVVVTDTLPGAVLFESVDPSQGTCEGENIILCDLATINANSSASITIVVSPTIDGGITNLAAVGSSGYELNLGDNSSEEDTLVDWTPPVVNWIGPVENGGTFLAFGGMVTLEASASDNDKVAQVEFRLWDHNHNQWISIGSDSVYPYQVPFNSSILEVNQAYQTFVIGVDRAGNQSNPYDPLQRIFIERKLPVFIPVLRK
jgi:uncharacterized repeat protein (TIGR01451 family)